VANLRSKMFWRKKEPEAKENAQDAGVVASSSVAGPAVKKDCAQLKVSRGPRACLHWRVWRNTIRKPGFLRQPSLVQSILLTALQLQFCCNVSSEKGLCKLRRLQAAPHLDPPDSDDCMSSYVCLNILSLCCCVALTNLDSCAPLSVCGCEIQKMYEECFRQWYTDKFLRGERGEACIDQWEVVRVAFFFLSVVAESLSILYM